MPKTKELNTGLVAVSDRNGGFHVYLTAGLWDPSRWLLGRLDGSGWFASKEELHAAAEREGRTLTKHADYYQLRVSEVSA